MLRLAGVSLHSGHIEDNVDDGSGDDAEKSDNSGNKEIHVNLKTVASRNAMMDVYTGEMLSQT